MTTLRARIGRVAQAEKRAVARGNLVSAAVLVGIVPRDEGPCLIFTKRTMTVATHKGQISFPGGMAEPKDENLVATALREAHEEIGLAPEHAEVLGILDQGTTPSGFVVTPVIAFVSPKITFMPQPSEVEEVFEAPLSVLTDPNNRSTEIGMYKGNQYKDRRFKVGDHVIWGITGRIVHGFLQALERAEG